MQLLRFVADCFPVAHVAMMPALEKKLFWWSTAMTVVIIIKIPPLWIFTLMPKNGHVIWKRMYGLYAVAGKKPFQLGFKDYSKL